mmetsp:Transcript_12409/g.29208  ORF Transcript_12409/g.29208 Transcript_12409/m.29208 type:complete len:622 (-) Transcript_12409:302-2167(-)|eukprot:CAMPEP_0178395556 /NCGR_PEP_ID=MMETSP0689_2-20121128/13279_1 /TAXON_ID=160604 /ORGANISM="Amphidinium massartii, Strain CS-259" /LENGTH=621 /DNA_ID=CAMNT_0020016213 /DNA_START=31 /DNA_END=1896 /DNA_ORIENTATION=+
MGASNNKGQLDIGARLANCRCLAGQEDSKSIGVSAVEAEIVRTCSTTSAATASKDLNQKYQRPFRRSISSSGKATSLDKAMLRSMDCHFPMFCLPIFPAFQELLSLQSHEALSEQLVKPSDDMICHFVSHEWLSFSHPDPDGVQLRRMQEILQAFSEGRAKSLFSAEDYESFLLGATQALSRQALRNFTVKSREPFAEDDLPSHTTGGAVWMDYFSIPQKTSASNSTFTDAVNSLPHYVERSDYFWVCAPTAEHAEMKDVRDFNSWRRRGWCRMEEVANLFSKTVKVPLIVTSSNTIATHSVMACLERLMGRPERSVGNGLFSCCQLEHKQTLADGTSKELKCDKHILNQVVAHLFALMFDFCGYSQDHFRRAVVRAVAPALFAGLPAVNVKHIADPKDTLDGFRSRASQASAGTLNIGGHGWSPSAWVLFSSSHSVLLELLQSGASTAEEPNLAFLPMLAVHLPAEVYKKQADVLTLPKDQSQAEALLAPAVELASRLGFHENLQTLLQARASPATRHLADEITPLGIAAKGAYHECCAVLLAHRADVNATDANERTALHYAANPVSLLGSSLEGAKCATVSVLMDHRANAHAADAAGQTPLQLATALGFKEAVELMKKA